MFTKYVAGLIAVGVVGLANHPPSPAPGMAPGPSTSSAAAPTPPDGAAEDYAFSIRPDGQIRCEIPSLKEVVAGKTDGQPMAIHRPGAPADMTLSVTLDGLTVLRDKVTRGGKPFGEGRMTLIEDAKAWIDIT
jgi:hypothetical protein